jgi:hypothetical protein
MATIAITSAILPIPAIRKPFRPPKMQHIIGLTFICP